MGFPSGSLGTSHSWASGPPKTMKLVAQAFQPVPGHPRAGVLHFQSRNRTRNNGCDEQLNVGRATARHNYLRRTGWKPVAPKAADTDARPTYLFMI
jgi:hypothetical protein